MFLFLTLNKEKNNLLSETIFFFYRSIVDGVPVSMELTPSGFCLHFFLFFFFFFFLNKYSSTWAWRNIFAEKHDVTKSTTCVETTELDRENPDFPPYLISHGQKIGSSRVLLATHSEVANCVCATLQV